MCAHGLDAVLSRASPADQGNRMERLVDTAPAAEAFTFEGEGEGMLELQWCWSGVSIQDQPDII
jgi:hypothetical protein